MSNKSFVMLHIGFFKFVLLDTNATNGLQCTEQKESSSSGIPEEMFTMNVIY